MYSYLSLDDKLKFSYISAVVSSSRFSVDALKFMLECNMLSVSIKGDVNL